jgi:hypothetical protein
MKRKKTQKPSRAAVNQARYRARLRAGKQVYSICLGCDELDGMVRLRWLSDDDVLHRDRVERALESGLADALK